MTEKDPYQTSIEAVWHDPTSYDPMKHAPPYMPRTASLTRNDRTSIRKWASSQVSSQVVRRIVGSVAPLSSLLAVLRAGVFIHHTHHWQTRGGHYYADHLLFERLYTESEPFVDQVGERAVGSGNIALVDPIPQVQKMSQLVGLLAGADRSPEALVTSSLSTETLILSVIDEVRSLLEGSGALSNGTDNLLQGIADAHEVFVYLLKQRAAQPSVYDYGR